MTQIFGRSYADAYDALYQDKEYETECDVIEKVFQDYSSEPVRTVLDLGCGTGNHSIPLAKRGYQVLGIDRSEAMLENARSKAAALDSEKYPQFLQGDIRTVRIQSKFDAVLIMFAVLGYQLTNADVTTAFETARQHLKPHGLLIFDVWYGPAVLTQKPSERIKIVSRASGQLIRASSGELDTMHHLTHVHYHLWEIEQARLVRETQETHTMRFFFYPEIELFLEKSGLQLLRVGRFPDYDEPPNEETWNVIGIAQAF